MQLIKVFTFLFLLFAFSTNVHADFSQTDFSVTATENIVYNSYAYQYLGVGLQGTLTSASYASIVSNATYFACPQINVYSSYDNFVSDVASTTIQATGNRAVTSLGSGSKVTCDYSASFDPSLHYAIALNASNFGFSPSSYFLGSNSGSGYFVSSGTTGSLGSIYYELIGTVQAPPTEQVFSSVNYQTKFTAFDYDLSSTTLTIDTDYFIELSEVDTTQSSRNPTLICYRYLNTFDESPIQYSYCDDITPLVQGDSSAPSAVISGFTDGVYVIEIAFSNIAHKISNDINKRPFKETYIIFEIQIEDGVIVAENIDPIYDGTNIVSNSACSDSLIGSICSIFAFLFIPGDFSTTAFTDVLSEIDSKKPFSYFYQTTDVISSVASTTTSSEFVNLEVTINLPPVSGTYPILTKDTLDSIYDEDTRLMVRSVIGYGLWIIFALTVIYMLLNIFNRAVYLGEQGTETVSQTQMVGNTRVTRSVRSRF